MVNPSKSPPRVLDQGFRATFPRRIRSHQLVELRFTAPIYLQATRFDAFSRRQPKGADAATC